MSQEKTITTLTKQDDETIEECRQRRREARHALRHARGRRVRHHGQPTGVPGGWNRAARMANPKGYLNWLLSHARQQG